MTSDLRQDGPAAARWLLASTLAIAAIVTATSLLGLFGDWAYAAETQNWRLQAQGQDVGNLLAVVALLAGGFSMSRGSTRGLLIWASSLLYLIYAFAIYAVALHFGGLFLPYLAVLGLSSFSLAFGIRGRRHDVRLAGRSRTAACWVLIVIGTAFGLLWLGSIIPSLIVGQEPAELATAGLVANPVHVLDLALVLPAMIITGVEARRGRPEGLLWLVPWLGFSTLMGASVVAAMVLIMARETQGATGPLVFLLVVVAASVWSLVAALRQLELSPR
ncbi:MAG: hypothetical protein WCF12_05625 [Propionicimonas sp.]